MTGAVGRPLVVVALGALLALAACGSVTAKRTDGGGTGGTHADSSTKLDAPADRKTEDAHQDVSSSGKDMRTADALMSDARVTDASSSKDASNTGGQCKSDADCTLYLKAGKNCCGVCQPTSAPAPSMPTCLVACSKSMALVSCGCVNQQCVGAVQ